MHWKRLPPTSLRFYVRSVENLQVPEPGTRVSVRSVDGSRLEIEIHGRTLLAEIKSEREACGSYFADQEKFHLFLEGHRGRQSLRCEVLRPDRGDPKVGSWTADEDGGRRTQD